MSFIAQDFDKLLSYSEDLKRHYDLYQLLFFHFQNKELDKFFGLIEDNLKQVRPLFQTVFKTFLKDKEKIVNALQLPYSNAKLEATNNLIKLIKRNAFGFRNFENFKKGFSSLSTSKKKGRKLSFLDLSWLQPTTIDKEPKLESSSLWISKRREVISTLQIATSHQSNTVDIEIKNGEWGIRTPAPVTRPNDLANRPLQPLE